MMLITLLVITGALSQRPVNDLEFIGIVPYRSCSIFKPCDIHFDYNNGYDPFIVINGTYPQRLGFKTSDSKPHLNITIPVYTAALRIEDNENCIFYGFTRTAYSLGKVNIGYHDDIIQIGVTSYAASYFCRPIGGTKLVDTSGSWEKWFLGDWVPLKLYDPEYDVTRTYAYDETFVWQRDLYHRARPIPRVPRNETVDRS
ncbi:hypothetical protein [Beihai sea slater virus 4]|uniref:hypothetical protein n=1 Tax=Beihai sea slater virus 4 TaxID=1922660 RepID=UPI00090B4FF3|nr:hypothetical protein [Beihai sea slater virus 4]APG77559.1 hypothetical protein [Beihai sea slater virus 4]